MNKRFTNKQFTNKQAAVRLITLLMCFLFQSCSTGYQKENERSNSPLSDVKTDLITTNDQRALFFEKILIARIAAGQQQYEKALKYYLAVLDIKVEMDVINEAISISEKLNDHKSALLIAELWTEFRPEDVTPWEVIAFYSLSDEQTESASAALMNVIEMKPDPLLQLNFFERLTSGSRQADAFDVFKSLMEKYPDNSALPLAIARIHQLKQQWPEALTLTAKVLKADPGFLAAHKYHGSTLIFSGANAEAIGFYQNALILFPESDVMHYSLGQLLYDMDRFQEAREHFQHIAEHSPKDHRSHYMIAATYFAENNYPKSREFFLDLLKVRSHRNAALFYMGEMARNESDPTRAINYYRQIRFSRYYSIAHNLVARLLHQQGQYVEALDYLLNIKANNETDAVNFKISRLKIMYNQKDFQQAKQYLELVLKQHSTNINIQLYHIQWLIERDEPDTVIKVLPEIIALFPTFTEQKRLVLNATASLQESGNTPSALIILNNQLSVNEDSDYRYIRALFAAEVGDFSLAETDLRYILSTDPEHTNALNALGYTLADTNKNLPEALKLIEKAYSSDPESPAIVDSMGWVLYRLGDLTQALQYLQQAYKIDPSSEIAAHLGEVLWEIGKKNKAKEILLIAINKEPENKIVIDTMKKYQISNEGSRAKP
ncbi:MAG: tetratricopeptide repeat protein [Gammaproteobacteria bacterium]|nr:tetratricopeptide repeat protein [Gammaproteobacteria bacterium]